MADVKKLDRKHAGTSRGTKTLSSSFSGGGKHGTTVSKRLTQSCSPAMRTKSLSRGKPRESQSPTKSKLERVLHVKQVPTLPKKRSLQSSKAPKMLVEGKQHGQEKNKRCNGVGKFKSSHRSSNESSNKVIKKLSTSVQKGSAKLQNSRKTKSLPCSTTLTSAKRLCVRLERQSVPDRFTKKPTNKHAPAKVASTSKTWQPSEYSDSSDNDILYSLAVPSKKTSSSAAVASNNHSVAAKRHKHHKHTGANGGVVEPDTDSEISFRHSPLKHALKKDFHKQKRKATCEPGLYCIALYKTDDLLVIFKLLFSKIMVYISIRTVPKILMASLTYYTCFELNF